MKAFGMMLIFVTFCVAVSTRTSAQCSIVKLNSLSKIAPGTPIKITAELSATIPAAKLSFKWTVSAGTITSGDNSPSITIDTAGLGGQTINVTVEVIGVTTSCRDTAEKTIEVELPPPLIEKFDIYGDIKFEDEKARLDNFAIQIQNCDKSYFAHIVAYAGRRTFPNEASDRLKRAKDYLVKVRGVNPSRIIMIDGGYRNELQVWLWILPGGTSPIWEWEHIPRDQLDFSKPRPRQSKRRH